MIKQIIIPAAAFAITVTGASAFSSDMLENIDVDLTTEQVTALEEVHELRLNGADREVRKAVLEDAGIDKETMREVRKATHEYRDKIREAVHTALEDSDYDAYQEAVAETPRAELIDTEEQFELLVEAHTLREEGNHEEAKEIMSELGFEKPEGHGKRGGHFGNKEGREFGGPGFQNGNRQSAE